MDPQSKMKALFQEWSEREHHQSRERIKGFIADGPIDYKLWESSDYKVLFLLKEAYASDKWAQPLDLCQHIRDWGGPKYKIWHTVAAWAFGLQQMRKNGGEIHRYPRSEDKSECRNALFSASIVNIKKSGGESTSNDENLYEYIEKDWNNIFEQIRLLHPGIIVCGGTWWNVVRKYLIKSEGKNSFRKLGEWVYEYKGYYFIDFWHPANQYPNKLNYYSLCAAVQMAGILNHDQ